MAVHRRVLASVVSVALVSIPVLALPCIIDPCETTVELHSTVVPVPLVACPQGDTGSFVEQGWSITITVRGCAGEPVPSIPASDIWLVDGALNEVVLCGGYVSSNADAMTDAQGMTTMSVSTLSAGGCADGLSVVVQGFVPLDTVTCTTYQILPIHVRSPDIDGSLTIDLVDLSIFSAHYPPGAYNGCSDFDINGTINVADLAEFAAHYGPPGHSCD